MVTSAYFDIARCLAPCADTKRCRESQSLRRRVSSRCPEWAKLESGDACSKDADVYYIFARHLHHLHFKSCVFSPLLDGVVVGRWASDNTWQDSTSVWVRTERGLVSFLRQHNNPDNLTHNTPQQQWCYRYVAFPKISTASKKKPQNDSATATN